MSNRMFAVFNPKASKRALFSYCVARLLKRATLLALALVWSLPTTGQVFFTPQPAGSHSTLVDINRQQILDNVFSGWVRNALIQNGTTNVRDAKFLFQECFGGGMLDDLQRDLGSTVSWVGGSASRWDQPSWGHEAPPPAGDYWTDALLPELPRPQTLLTGINNARANDAFRLIEEGQSLVANGGEAITLKDPAARAHHAILWAGDTLEATGSVRFRNDIDRMFTALNTAWAGSNYSITVLFGAGAQDPLAVPNWGAIAATQANLQAAINAAGADLTPDGQFLFYASDHGGLIEPISGTPILIGPGGFDIEGFFLEREQLIALEHAAINLNVPQLIVSYTGLTVSSPVEWNGFLLGSLDPNTTTTIFDVPINVLAQSNIIRIFNNGQFAFTIHNKFFDFGDIPTITLELPSVVPEPSTLTWLALGIAGILYYRWGHRKQHLRQVI